MAISQELDHVVQRGRVTAGLVQDREHVLQLVPERLGRQLPVPGLHPVAVAAQRVDLPVVGQVSERVGQRPTGEGVGAEPAVDDGDGRGEVGIAQVGVVPPQLRGGEHALVDHPVARQDADVELLPRGGRQPVVVLLAPLDGVLRVLADQVQPAVEVLLVVEPVAGAEEQLLHARLDQLGRRTDERLVDRHVAPAQHGHAVLDRHALHDPLAQVALDHVLRQEDHPHAVLARSRQRDVQLPALPAEERIGRPHEDAGPVAAVLLAAAGAAVVHVLQHQQRIGDDLM
jgi:hypothetical protein